MLISCQSQIAIERHSANRPNVFKGLFDSTIINYLLVKILQMVQNLSGNGGETAEVRNSPKLEG